MEMFSQDGAKISSLLRSPEVLTDPVKSKLKIKAVFKDSHDAWLSKAFDVLSNREVDLPNAYIEVSIPTDARGLSQSKLHERLVNGASALTLSGYQVLTSEFSGSFVYRIVRR